MDNTTTAQRVAANTAFILTTLALLTLVLLTQGTAGTAGTDKGKGTQQQPGKPDMVVQEDGTYLEEDEAGWTCKSMGNRQCGPE